MSNWRDHFHFDVDIDIGAVNKHEVASTGNIQQTDMLFSCSPPKEVTHFIFENRRGQARCPVWTLENIGPI